MLTRADSHPRAVAVEPIVCRLLLLGLLAYAVPAGMRLQAQSDRIPAWWNAAVLLVVLLGVVAASLGRPRSAALALWLATVIGALSLPAVVEGPLGGPAWLGLLSPVAIASTVLLSRRASVCAAAVGVILVAGALARRSLVPEPARPDLPQLVLLVAVWAGALAVLRSLQFAQRRVEGDHEVAIEEFVAARAAEATVRAEQAWDAFLHDEVMASLARIAQGDGPTARAEALRVLHQRRVRTGGPVPTPRVGDGVLDVVMHLRPDAETLIAIEPGVDAVPDEVRRAVLEAVSEALRNVERHAYEPTGRGPSWVQVLLDEHELRVEVTDRGRGFNHKTVTESRMGMALSIQARMDAVGGWSRIESVPGSGTTVRLGWVRQPGDER